MDVRPGATGANLIGVGARGSARATSAMRSIRGTRCCAALELLRRVGSAEDASDVVADAMLVAWRRIGYALRRVGPLWLYGVARRVLVNHHRGGMRLRADVLLAGSARLHPEAQPPCKSAAG
jgi:sigma-70-like protein